MPGWMRDGSISNKYMNLFQRLFPFLRKAEPAIRREARSVPRPVRPSPPPARPSPPPRRIRREAFERRDRPDDWEVDYPPTIGKMPEGDDPAAENLYYDPALAHYQRGFRRADPAVTPAVTKLWQDARYRAMQHLLAVVADSEWGGQLVLRGSVALKSTLGDKAREPGDIDWVVQPDSLRMDEPAAKALLDGIIETVRRSPRAGGIVFDTEAIARNDIWTYERAPGHRIVFPWTFGELPPGVLQMDFVFQEFLRTQPQEIDVSLCDAPAVRMKVASNEESLAWKLVWLFSDTHPQGKDLYDAVLLAERATLSGALLKQALIDADNWRPEWISREFPFRNSVRTLEWGGMPAGLPSNDEEGAALAVRLAELIRPAVQECQALAQGTVCRLSME
jgi:hypothetical protein